MQTSYSQDPTNGLDGLVAMEGLAVTAVAEGAGCVPGRFVVAGTTPGDQAKAPAGAWTESNILGFVQLDQNREVAAYSAGETLAIMRRGEIWVTFEAGVTPTPGTPVYGRHTANGGNTTLGLVRANADTGAAVIAGAHFREVSGTRARIELNL